MAGMWILMTDGASRGNPGEAAIGYVLSDPAGQTVIEHGEVIGLATNNVAEYRAVIAGLEKAASMGIRQIKVRSDSQLLVRQLLGQYRVRNAGLKPLYERVRDVARKFERTVFEHVPREENRRADELADEALDGNRSGSGPAVSDRSEPDPEQLSISSARRPAGLEGEKSGGTGSGPADSPGRKTDGVKASHDKDSAGLTGSGADRHHFRVRYGETDQMGVAYYANYLDWFTDGRTSFLRRRGIPYAELEADGVYLPVRSVECNYHQPARYDEELVIETEMVDLTPVRLKFTYRIVRVAEADAEADQGMTIIATGHTEHAFVDRQGRVLRVDRVRPDFWQRLKETSLGGGPASSL